MMTNSQLKQYAEEQFDLSAGDASERVKWAQVLAICLQTEAMVELNGNWIEFQKIAIIDRLKGVSE